MNKAEVLSLNLPALYKERVEQGMTLEEIKANLAIVLSCSPRTILRHLQEQGLLKTNEQKRLEKRKALERFRDFDVSLCNRNVATDKAHVEAIVLSLGRNQFGQELDQYFAQMNINEMKRLAHNENWDIKKMEQLLSCKKAVLKRLEETLPKESVSVPAKVEAHKEEPVEEPEFFNGTAAELEECPDIVPAIQYALDETNGQVITLLQSKEETKLESRRGT